MVIHGSKLVLDGKRDRGKRAEMEKEADREREREGPTCKVIFESDVIAVIILAIWKA